MRTLLISDIHSNLVALTTVLAQAGPHDAVWCLGDIVGYGPSPNECLEILRGLNPVCLAGNHDWGALGKLPLEDFNTPARRAIEWTDKQLSRENREWLDHLPPRMDLPGDNLTLVHGSPRHPIWEYITTPSVASENLPFFSTNICLFGHTHVPAIFRQDLAKHNMGGQRLTAGDVLELGGQGRVLANPGSVGQPRDGDPRASYAILDTEALSFSLFRVEYDIAATQAAMVQVKLPAPLIARLAYGA